MSLQNPGSSLPSLSLKLPPVIGHRGAAGRAPENTLTGLRRARTLGCSWVEFDVRLTADGALVLCHDTRLDRTTDRTGLVAGQSLATIRQCDAGSWFGPAFAGEQIPTLEEALTLAAELGLGTNIEIKADRGREYATAAAVADIVNRLGSAMPALLVSSFLPSALYLLRDLAPRTRRGVLFRSVPSFWAETAAQLGVVVIGADHRRLRPQRVAEIRASGYLVTAYTVNNPERARLLFAWGVTSVFSDVPDMIWHAGAADDATRPTPSAPPETARAPQGAHQ
ncbi:MAG: glycerophosphodiester phosphodiesterase family protein [Alphaproteobacteria bacterium]